MAQKGIEQSVQQKKLELTHWANNMLKHIQNKFSTQNVWPMGYPGPYSGYRNTPAAKKSTGDGLNSLYALIWSGSNGDTEKISFFFNYYLYFVDMGVGAKKTYQFQYPDATWNKRYKEWLGEGNRQSRPVIGMEVRHQLRRLEAIVSAHYGELIENGIINSLFDGLDEKVPATGIIYKTT